MITFCIPSKNNLRYLKTCIPSIKQNSYYKTNKILVFVDQDQDGTVQWLDENNIDYILNKEVECKGIGYAYDTMFKQAQTDLVVAFHADMVLGPDADYHLVKHHKRGTVVCATRIEPPLHPPGPEKVVMDFGMWPEDTKWDEFDSFVKKQTNDHLDRVTSSMFAPWLIHKQDHLGHDPIFLSVFEDADLFRRFKLANYSTIQSWSSYVYHLTCRGGQFEHAKTDQDLQTKSTEWQYKNQLSFGEYIRKWGGSFKEYGPCEPKPNTKYNVGVRLTNAVHDLLSIEPFFSQLNVDCDYQNYIAQQTANTSFDLKSKFVDNLTTDIIIEFDCKVGNLQELEYITTNMEELISQTEEDSTYTFGTTNLQVKRKTTIPIQIKL